MTMPRPDRRQLVFGLAASGLAMSGERAAAMSNAPPPSTNRQPGSPPAGLQHGMRPCRFGAIHYRYVEASRASGAIPLLCLHASPGSAIGFANFLPLMGTDRLAIAADNPGFGLSDRPATPSTIADFAGAMCDLIDSLGIKHVDLLGSHTGAATAVEMARQRPKAVRRIILHSALMFTPQEIADYEARLEGSVPADLNAAAARLPDLWQKFARFRAELGDDTAWELFWEMNRDPTHSGWGHDAAFAYDFATTLRQLQHPILVLNPKEGLSPITARARGATPNLRMQDLPWSNGLFSAHAADVAPLVRAYLDK